jgi:succinate dehydrogenase / fumarate reductase flavoprotein subunit/fumarate reductase flavoprotein subunit
VKRRTQQESKTGQVAETEAAARRFLGRGKGESPWVLRDELGKMTWERVGIVRIGSGLRRAVEELAALGARSDEMAAPGGQAFNLTWQQALDVSNLVTVSRLIAQSALLREDSRGAHYREDFPNLDNANWLKNVFVARDGAGVRSWTEGVKLTRLTP